MTELMFMARRRKILIDARMYGLEHSGIGRYLVNLTKELKALGTEEKFIILLRRRYFKSLKFPKNWKKVLADFKHYGLVEQLKLPNVINEHNPDLVHFPHFNIPVFWRGKFIVTIHDMTMHKQGISATNLPLPIYFLKRIPYKYTFKKAVSDSVKIITPSKAVKKDICEHYKVNEEKITPIYESFDNVYSKVQERKSIMVKHKLNEDFFVYTGNAYPHKNTERVVEAVQLLNRQLDEKIAFVIAGSRDVFTKRIEEYVKKLGAEKYVRHIGFVSDKDLAYLYKRAAGFVYPSLSEGFGLQGLEVMAAGGLLLASDIPVFREVYGKNALYFNPYDFSSISKTMKEVLEIKDTGRRKRIKKAQKYVKKFSWTRMTKETLKVYKEALV